MKDQEDIDPVDFAMNVTQWAPAVDMARLYALNLPGAVADRLAASPRLSKRHAAFAAAQLGPVDFDALSSAELALVLASPTLLDTAALMAGAVWHGRRVRGLVLAADVATFVAACGAAARQAAIRHTALDILRSNAETPLLEAVRQDGLACRAAWIEQLPIAIGRRLKLRPGIILSPFDELHRHNGPGLMRRIAEDGIAL